jgi:hypothetical protein
LLLHSIVIEVAVTLQAWYIDTDLITSAKEENFTTKVPRFTQCIALSCALAGLAGGMAAAQEPPNSDFEDGVLA